MTSTFKILESSVSYSSFFTECSPDTCQSVCLGCSAFHPHLHHIGPISSRYKVEGQTLFLSKVETLLGHLYVSFETAEHIKELKIRDMQSLTLANNALIYNLTKDIWNLPSILLATTRHGISGRYSRSSLYQFGRFLYVIFLWTSNTWQKQSY